LTDIDEIRRKRMPANSTTGCTTSSEAESQEQMQREIETQKRQAMMQLLTPEGLGQGLQISKTHKTRNLWIQIEIQLSNSHRRVVCNLK